MDMHGMRAPTALEAELIPPAVAPRYEGAIRCGVALTIFFAAIAMLALFLVLCASGTLLPAIAAALIPTFLAIFAASGVRHDKGMLEKLKAVDFLVMDGTVCEVGSNSDYPGYVQVRFKGSDGSVVPVWWRVRRRDGEIGAELLLICVPEYSKKYPTPGVQAKRELGLV